MSSGVMVTSICSSPPSRVRIEKITFDVVFEDQTLSKTLDGREMYGEPLFWAEVERLGGRGDAVRRVLSQHEFPGVLSEGAVPADRHQVLVRVANRLNKAGGGDRLRLWAHRGVSRIPGLVPDRIGVGVGIGVSDPKNPADGGQLEADGALHHLSAGIAHLPKGFLHDGIEQPVHEIAPVTDRNVSGIGIPVPPVGAGPVHHALGNRFSTGIRVGEPPRVEYLGGVGIFAEPDGTRALAFSFSVVVCSLIR
ncbi:unnamed protein product [Pseudo-nitzschia multistriata]|uniref:Uncharacterized protein n=1 Tax=Pseudo-nitzschia multistriata TaxID=183589 RepID=A0A448ZC71_9STRA|nr:unnamed protein product [Pseudo-nitzschia multistriata]